MFVFGQVYAVTYYNCGRPHYASWRVTETCMSREAVPLNKGETGGYFVRGIDDNYLC